MRAANARPRGLHPRRFAPMAARSARAHQVTNARPRPSAWALNSRPWQLATARAHQEDSARARGLHPGQFAAECLRCRFAPMAARFARAHREDSARPRRGMVLNSLRLVFSHLSGGVWRRTAPRPLRKTNPPNGGACGLLLFAPFVGQLVGISVF